MYPSLYKKLAEFKRNKIFTDTCQNIQQGIKEGFFREEIDCSFIAKITMGRMLFTMNKEFGIFSEEELSSIDLFDKTIDYHLNAICTRKGLNQYRKQLIHIQNEN